MANWNGVSRSNYVAVKDVEAFKAEMAPLEVKVEESQETPGTYCLIADTEYGGWPNYDDETDNTFDLEAIVAPHLADGQVCVFMSSGAERTRYVTGDALAFDNTGEVIYLNLNDIYELATDKFGVTPTSAEY